MKDTVECPNSVKIRIYGLDNFITSQMNLFVGSNTVDGQDGFHTVRTEAEYDALNDETVGDPDKGDWENMHETLMTLKKDTCISKGNENDRQWLEGDELHLHLLRFDFGDVDESMTTETGLSLGEDVKRRLILDRPTWGSPLMKQPDQSFPLSKQQEQSQCFPSNPMRNDFSDTAEVNFSSVQPPIKMLSVADIEKDIIHQQERLNKHTERHNKNPPGNQNNEEIMKKVPGINPVQPKFHSAQLQPIQNQMFPPPPVLDHKTRMPIGFLPYSYLPERYSPSINNVTMHPGFPIRSHHKHHMRQRHNIPKRSDYDEYSNLMSNREKQWLIDIQLSQVNSDPSYISDYYFTVYKERVKALKGNIESKTYKENQLNHPFTQQPTGHKFLLMSSMSSKISESQNSHQKDQSPRTYAPLQFENSLGKLQCGSLIAPRKIIDMDVVGDKQNNTSLERVMQRKSRYILLLVESLFKVVLRMEDLKNPVAMDAMLIVMEKREKDLISQQRTNPSQHVSISSNGELDTFDDMLVILRNGLTQDKVTLMLSVRKGKLLLNRIFVLLRDHPFRWTLWSNVFSAIPLILKKDRDDKEGVLYDLYTQFERHVQHSNFVELLKLSETFGNEKILGLLTNCKFLLSSVIIILFQMEVLFFKTTNTVTPTEKEKWIRCLELITGIVGKLASTSTNSFNTQHMIKIDLDNNILRTVRVHLKRFPLEDNANDFLNIITSYFPSNDEFQAKE